MNHSTHRTLFISISTLLAASIIAEPVPVRSDEDALAPNEAGRVMVLMYHSVGETEGVWRRSKENFEGDLRTLHDRGYRPVRLTDYVAGRIDLAAGLSPVVLTFDDGREDNFRVILKDGKPTVDPDSAVGILEAFAKNHPGFEARATFFVNGEVPFGQTEWVDFKLNYLVEHGMDVGNHTAKHDNFALPKYNTNAAIERAIGKQANFLSSRIDPSRNYSINTLALCHGARPKTPALRKSLKKGVFDGVPYENVAILNVGAGPARSPFDRRFNPASIPRIRAGEIKTEGFGINDWLERFDKNPKSRYVSDGDPKKVTVQKGMEKYIDRDGLGEMELVILD